MYFRGLIFTIPSTLLITLVRHLYINFIFITLLMNHLLTEQMRHSNNSCYHGAREKRYFHFISWLHYVALMIFLWTFCHFQRQSTLEFLVVLYIFYDFVNMLQFIDMLKCLSRSPLTLHKFIYIYNFWSYVYFYGVLWCKLVLLLLWTLGSHCL